MSSTSASSLSASSEELSSLAKARSQYLNQQESGVEEKFSGCRAWNVSRDECWKMSMDSRTVNLSFGIDKILSRDLNSNNFGDTIPKFYCINNSTAQSHFDKCEMLNIQPSCSEFHHLQYPFMLTEEMTFHFTQSTSKITGNIVKPAPLRPIPQVTLNAAASKIENNCRRRSWSRAVFSSLQRKGLEKRFAIQKYITKPDRRQLAATLGLTDAQVKVWFQNRRMKWRHTKENGISSSSQSIYLPRDDSELSLLDMTKETKEIGSLDEFEDEIEIS